MTPKSSQTKQHRTDVYIRDLITIFDNIRNVLNPIANLRFKCKKNICCISAETAGFVIAPRYKKETNLQLDLDITYLLLLIKGLVAVFTILFSVRNLE